MRTRIVVSVGLLLGLAGVALAQSNLIRNPGFEGGATAKALPDDGWWLYEGRGQPEVALDATAHTGRAAVRFHAREDTRCALVSAPFDVSPGDEISFAGWARSDAALPAAARSNFGLAFRDAAGRVFERVYVPSAPGSSWTPLTGKATVPANAVRAEIHLGYSAAPGTLWYDDVSAVITNPISFALAEGPQPWTGPQTITVRVQNRQPTAFRGTVRAVVAKQTTEAAVALEPGATQVVKVPIVLPGVGNFDYKLSLRDAAGAESRAAAGKFRAAAPLALLPPVPCYHIIGQGSGDTRFEARVLVNPARREGLRFKVSVRDASGAEVQAASADASTGDVVGVTLRVPSTTAARFDVQAQLVDATGRELAKASTDVRISNGGEAKVALGADGFLRLNGRPHFPVGLYSAGRYEEMAQGFTATHNYGITTGDAADAVNPNDANLKDLLDRSWANGMRMMVELPRKAIEKAQWAQVRRRIETFRNHPGLLCWGSEERVARGEAPLANIAQLYQLVHEMDPAHPLVLGDTRDVVGKLQKDRRNFFPDFCMDIGIWWWYPIPLHGPDGNGLDGRETNSGLLQPPSWLTTTTSKKPLWIAIQSYQQPRQDARFPTPAEYRCMAYLSIINGVKGLWFYTGSGQRDWQGKPAGLLNKPAEGHWDYVRQLARELGAFEGVIAAPKPRVDVKLAPADAPVEFALREADGARYLIAANKSDRPQQVRFTAAAFAGRKPEVLFEDGATATIEGDSLVGNFAPFGVHVYRLK